MGFQEVISYKNPRDGAGGGGVYWHLKVYKHKTMLNLYCTIFLSNMTNTFMVTLHSNVKT